MVKNYMHSICRFFPYIILTTEGGVSIPPDAINFLRNQIKSMIDNTEKPWPWILLNIFLSRKQLSWSNICLNVAARTVLFLNQISVLPHKFISSAPKEEQRLMWKTPEISYFHRKTFQIKSLGVTKDFSASTHMFTLVRIA